MIFCILISWCAQAQQRYPTLIRSSLEDEIIMLSVDQPVYFPGDTVYLTVQRNDSTTTVVTPILIIEGSTLKSINRNIYRFTIPQACTPGMYRVRLGVQDAQGRRFVYETDCSIDVSRTGGGFAVSIFLDVAEITRIIGIDLLRKFTAGLEVAPFFPLEKRARVLVDAQVSISL